MSPSISDRIEILRRTANKWADPAYAVRVDVMRETLRQDNQFTAEAIHFAINQRMASIEAYVEGQEWLEDGSGSSDGTVAVLNSGNIPFVGLSDLVGVWLSGRNYFGVTSSKSASLLPAFAYDLSIKSGVDTIGFGTLEEALATASLVVATGSDKTMAFVRKLVGEKPFLVRGSGYSIGVMTGSESVSEADLLAEDILLHEGLGCRNVSVLWVDDKQRVDQLLTSMTAFRQIFPAHERTRKRLKNDAALLAAADIPHLFAEDYSFLISGGDPAPQSPGHLRVSEYDSLSEVTDWIVAQGKQLQVVATSSETESLDRVSQTVRFGMTQRPHLFEHRGDENIVQFLRDHRGTG